MIICLGYKLHNMDARRNSENEELRKQIEFLTEIIKNAKSERKYSDQTQHVALPYQTQAAYSAQLKYSKPHTRRGATIPGLTDPASHNRPMASAHTANCYHWGPSNSYPSFGKKLSCHVMKHQKPPLSSMVTEIEKTASKQTLTANKSRSENSKGACGVKAVDKKDTASLHQSLPSHATHSSIAALPSLTSSSKCSKYSDTVLSEEDTSLNLKHQNQMRVKSQAAFGVTGTDIIEMKSTQPSGNKLPSKSDPKLLQKEIEKMHNKITELKKMISERKFAPDHKGRKIQNDLRSSGLHGNSDMVCSLPLKKEASETNVSLLSQVKLTLPKTSSFSQCEFNKGVIVSPGKASAEVCAGKGLQRSDVRGLSLVSGKCNPTTNSKDSLTQAQSDLVSVSKYKLTRVGSSPSKQSSVVTEASGSKAISSLPSKQENFLNVEQFKSSMRQSLISSLTSNTRSDTRAPAKFAKKSKYSISRVKNSGKKGLSRNKLIRRHSSTPAKFISFSKYAIKRVRRSLSDEGRQASKDIASSVKGIGKYKNVYPSPGSVQNSVTVVKSKFKMEKVPLAKLIAKNRYKLSQSAPYYKFDRSKFYRQRDYYSYRQGYKERQHWNARISFHGFIKRGRYNSRYRGQGRNYKGYVGRYQKAFQHGGYNRRQAVSQRYIQRRIELLKEKIPFNPKHRLDRRTVVADKKRALNFVMINGMLYRSNAKTLEKAVSTKTPMTTVQHQTTIKKSATSNMKTVTVRGVKFEVDPHGRSLKRVHQLGKAADATSLKTGQVSRIDIGGVTYMQTKPGTLERVGSVKSRMAAARVVNKTVQQAAARYKKINTKVKKMKKYCMFYNRFGKCNKKGKCPYIHDPEKVAVCTRFLRGTCKVKDCPFSHKVSKDKMPVCSYFLKGVCNRDDCPYLHVNVNRDAEVCGDFLKGYCPLAEKCTKKHILKCPEFSKTGACSKGVKCKLQHRKANKRTIQTREGSILENSKKPKLSDQVPAAISTILPIEKFTQSEEQGKVNLENSISMPFKERKLPAYISLKTSNSERKEDITVNLVADKPLTVSLMEKDKPAVKPTMRIRPQL